MATLEAIQARIKKLEAQAQVLKVQQASGVIKQIHDLMARHGLAIGDIAGFNGKAARKTKAPASAKTVGKVTSAKYADPKTGATWSGRGRTPAWIASARDRNAFLVADGAESAARTTAPAARKKATRKGPQRALYRDPMSGLTWSGFGRAPGWIASAKDRSAFLIEGSGVADKSGAAKKAVAKEGAAAKKSETDAVTTATKAKPAAKKAAAKKPTATRKAGAKKATAKKATAKKATAAKKAVKTAATKRGSTGARPARKSRSETQSAAPAAETAMLRGETEAADAASE